MVNWGIGELVGGLGYSALEVWVFDGSRWNPPPTTNCGIKLWVHIKHHRPFPYSMAAYILFKHLLVKRRVLLEIMSCSLVRKNTVSQGENTVPMKFSWAQGMENCRQTSGKEAQISVPPSSPTFYVVVMDTDYKNGV